MLDVDVKGIEELNVLFDRIEEAIDPERVLDEAGAILLNRIRTRFLAETDPFGRKWIPSQAALERKRKGRGGGTLFDSGTLFHSIQLVNRGPFERSIMTDVPYARKHQEGDGVLQRVFLGFSNEDAEVVEKLLKLRYQEAANG